MECEVTVLVFYLESTEPDRVDFVSLGILLARKSSLLIRKKRFIN